MGDDDYDDSDYIDFWIIMFCSVPTWSVFRKIAENRLLQFPIPTPKRTRHRESQLIRLSIMHM